MNIIFIFLIISLIAEYVIMLYYCNSTLDYRSSAKKSTCIVTAGYIIYCIICLFVNTIVNICGFIIINFIVIYSGYKISVTNTIIKVCIFTALMMFSELIASLLINTEINHEFHNIVTIAENMMFSFVSKILYMTSMVIFKHMSINRDQKYKVKEMICLIILPISTCLFLSAFNKINDSLNAEMEMMFVLFSILLVISNFVVYIVCERIIENNIQIQELKQLEYKKEIDEKSYQLIKEKYSELRILVHDFEKYCNYINGQIADKQNDVQSITQKIKDKNREFLIIEYTSNKALNILLSQKVKECNKKKIDFKIYAQSIDLSFIEENDTIAIFGNMIDNAIESCMLSENRKMFLQIYMMNDKFIVINLENSADKEPVIEDGKLASRKKDKDNHGIGMKSIKKALETYNGQLQWDYESNRHVFNTTILISMKRNNAKKITDIAM